MDLKNTIVPGVEHEELERIYKLSSAQKLVDDMTAEVEKYTKLLNLAKADQIEVVKHNVNYFKFISIMPSASNYLNMINDKNVDKRSRDYKEKKFYFETLTKTLSEEVFKVPVTITKIMSGGYESYYYEINFTIPDNKYTFTFTIPNTEKIRLINFDSCFKGKLAFGYYEPDRNHCHNIEYTSYRIEDITNAFEEFIGKMEV